MKLSIQKRSIIVQWTTKATEYDRLSSQEMEDRLSLMADEELDKVADGNLQKVERQISLQMPSLSSFIPAVIVFVVLLSASPLLFQIWNVWNQQQDDRTAAQWAQRQEAPTNSYGCLDDSLSGDRLCLFATKDGHFRKPLSEIKEQRQ